MPLALQEEGLDRIVMDKLRLDGHEADLDAWRAMVDSILHPRHEVRIAVVGEYVSLPDAYMSVAEALCHGGIANHARVTIDWLDANSCAREDVGHLLQAYDGVLIPGGVDDGCVEGKLSVIEYCREAGVPFLGICRGMQIAVIEFARNVAGLSGAHSTEIDTETPYPVIDRISTAEGSHSEGMRLGLYPCVLAPGSLAHKIYGEGCVYERHRHRYEVNSVWRGELEKAGMLFSGLSPDEQLAEISELPDHPFFLGCQFHPELRSRPNRPHPVFKAFVRASLQHGAGVGAVPDGKHV